MNRRKFILAMLALAATPLFPTRANAKESKYGAYGEIVKLELTEAEWKKQLTPAQFKVLRKEDTEPRLSSPLNNEKRDGTYVCAGCDLPLFRSDMKYDSGSGWPSFFTTMGNAVETKKDYGLFYSARTEYHCACCGGHQGHVFDDGPKPSGKRYCNNGLALKFIPDA
jgi:peptide-methionine (R)-S-oxide reductase